jgi:CheY-like chemotaxis protein
MVAQVRKILVLDGALGLCQGLELLLRRLGVEIRAACTDAPGLRLAEAWLPDLVLCDLRLPASAGLEFARQLQDLPALHDTTLIAVGSRLVAGGR